MGRGIGVPNSMRMPVFPDRRTQMPIKQMGVLAFGLFPSIDDGIGWVDTEDHAVKSSLAIQGTNLRPYASVQVDANFTPDSFVEGDAGSHDYSGTATCSLIDESEAVLQTVQITGGGSSLKDTDPDDLEYVESWMIESHCGNVSIPVDMFPAQFNGMTLEPVAGHADVFGGVVVYSRYPLWFGYQFDGVSEEGPQCVQQAISISMRP